MGRWISRLVALVVLLPLALACPAGCGRARSSGLLLFQTLDDRQYTIWQMNGDGTGRRAVVPWDEAVQGYGFHPRWAPDGRHFAYLYGYDEDGQHWESVRVADRDGGRICTVGEPAECVGFEWLGPDLMRIDTVRAGTVMTQSYQLSTGEIRTYEPPDRAGYQEWKLSPNGHTVALRAEGSLDYVLLDLRTGQRTVIFQAQEEARDGWPFGGYWSPDGRTLAFTYRGWSGDRMYNDLYVVEADGSHLRPLTTFASQYHGKGSPLDVSFVAWSPDGRWLAFILGVESTGWYLCVIPAAGGEIINLGIDPSAKETPVWSPDSTKLAFVTRQPFENGRFVDSEVNAQWDLYTVDIRTKVIQRLTNDRAMEMHVGWR